MTALALQVLLLVIINLRVILLLWYSDGDCPDRGLLWAVLMVAPPSREHGVCLHLHLQFLQLLSLFEHGFFTSGLNLFPGILFFFMQLQMGSLS